MIYHILNANSVHQIPTIIKSILSHADRTNAGGINEHFFIFTTNAVVSYSTKIGYIKGQYESIFLEYNFKNYVFIKSSIRQMIFLKKKSKKDKLIIHDTSLLFGRSGFFWTFLYLMGKGYCSNVSIMNWGVGMTKPKAELSKFSYFLHLIKKSVFQSFEHVITLTTEDEKKIREQYELTNTITTIYIHDAYKVFNNIIRTNDQNNVTRIMVSHSGWRQNNHLESLKLLERFKNNDIQIICPLSYGEPQYIDLVKEEGKRIFGEKFIYFQELLPIEEYYKLLGTINVFIANTSLQTSLHVVFFGICTGLKMYLKDNIYDSLKIEGFITNHISELNSVTFEELRTPIAKDWIRGNDEKAKDYFSISNRCEIWKQIYC